MPISGRNHIRNVIRKAIHCVRINIESFRTKLGNYSFITYKTHVLFFNTGINYAVFTKQGTRCESKRIKTYSVFVCFVTKALHLELVSNLTTDCFLNTLKRFMGCGGHVKNINLDNMTK